MTSIALILSFKKLNDMSGGLLLPPVAAAVVAFAIYKLTRPAPSVSLLGRRVLITGAANGIGKSIAELAVDRGASVDLWDYDGAGVETLRIALSKRRGDDASSSSGSSNSITCRRVDVSDDVSWNSAIASLPSTGGPDVFIACAGVVGGAPITALSSTLDRTLSVNVGGAARALAAGFVAGENLNNPPITIVLMGSLMGWLGAKRLADYCASKWAINGLADCARLEVNDGAGGGKSRTGIHLICPYIVDTELFAGAFGVPPPQAHWTVKFISKIINIFLPRLSSSFVSKSILDGVALNTGKHRTSFLPWTTRFIAQVPRLALFAKPAWFDAIMEVSGGRYGMDGWTSKKTSPSIKATASGSIISAAAARSKSPVSNTAISAARSKSKSPTTMSSRSPSNSKPSPSALQASKLVAPQARRRS